MPKVADMIREMSPDWSADDTRRATRYTHELLETIGCWDERRILDKLNYLKQEDMVFACVVWSMLPRPLRLYLEQINALERRTDRETDDRAAGDSESLRKGKG